LRKPGTTSRIKYGVPGLWFNIFKKYYRFHTEGQAEQGRWVHRETDLLRATPLERRIALALWRENLATATSQTRIPFGRKVLTGIGANMPPEFTGLPPGITTGGRPVTYIPGEYLAFQPL
jgi:hypothetical protein